MNKYKNYKKKTTKSLYISSSNYKHGRRKILNLFFNNNKDENFFSKNFCKDNLKILIKAKVKDINVNYY